MNVYLQAVGLGVIAGMRSMSAPALTSSHFSKHPSLFLEASPLKSLGSPITARVLKLLALGEIGADKLPGIPNRTAPGPLGARAVSGGVCGAAIFLAAGKPAGWGAALGASAAIASTYVAYFLRRWAEEVSKLPDAVLAGGEDALMLGIGKCVFAGERP